MKLLESEVEKAKIQVILHVNTHAHTHTHTHILYAKNILSWAKYIERFLCAIICQGVNMRGIVIVNPHNPTGRVYTSQTIQDVLSFADRYSFFNYLEILPIQILGQLGICGVAIT